MKTTSEKLSQKEREKTDVQPDMHVFTIYYLLKYKYITVEEANACTFFGIGSLYDFIYIFMDDDDNEEDLLKSCSIPLEMIDTFKKLCLKFSDPAIYLEEYQLFRKRYKRFFDKIKRKEERRLKELKHQNDVKNWEEGKRVLFEKLAGSQYGVLLNAPKKEFIEQEQISGRLAAVLNAMNDYPTAMDLLKVYVNNRIVFLRQKGIGAKTYKELEKICRKYIDKVKN
jgi:hypothetical protein